MKMIKKIFKKSGEVVAVKKKPKFSTYTSFVGPGTDEWYPPVILSPSTVESLATSSECLEQVMLIINQLGLDDYVEYLLKYYQAGQKQFGKYWRYSDIVTVLWSAARLINPSDYLEIGVRRGRGMAMVAATSPYCNIVGVDMWISNYAGIENPGPNYVYSEMEKLGYQGKIELLSGDSHVVVPDYFSNHPDLFFDLITVDGDHSEVGAEQDLRAVMPRLRVGGMLVFDDICHPAHPYLRQVWEKVVGDDPHFTTWEYDELGYGVAVGIRCA